MKQKRRTERDNTDNEDIINEVSLHAQESLPTKRPNITRKGINKKKLSTHSQQTGERIFLTKYFKLTSKYNKNSQNTTIFIS